MKEIYNLPLEIQMKIMKMTPHPLASIMKPVIKFFSFDVICGYFVNEYFTYLYYQPGLRCEFPLTNVNLPHLVYDHFNC